MNTVNKYCCRCHRTTRFQEQERSYTCTGCGVVIEKKERPEERALIGNPMRSYKTRFAA
ncbi:MAG: hypothetical protein HY901_06455 [Deltaproteobacteria bacterium]|nr:hypothetical protein [Deltaproteobacteria bacterium]